MLLPAFTGDVGAKVRVKVIQTNQAGNYKFPNVPFGRYFLAIRYGGGKFAVTGRPFRLGAQGPSVVRNIPFMTARTVSRYRGYAPTRNPGGLAGPPDDTSPSAP